MFKSLGLKFNTNSHSDTRFYKSCRKEIKYFIIVGDNSGNKFTKQRILETTKNMLPAGVSQTLHLWKFFS